MLDSETSALIGRIYGSTDAETLRSVMNVVVDRTTSRGAMVALGDPSRAEVVQPCFYGQLAERCDAIEHYEAEAHAQDPTLAFASAHPHARFFDTSMHMTPAQHGADPFIQWLGGAGGFTHWMTGYAQRADGLTFAVALHADGPASAESRRLFRMLFEHFERAHRLAGLPRDLSLEDGSLFILDGSGRVTAMSAKAEGLVAQGDGLSLQNRRLVLSARHAQRSFDCLVNSAQSALENGGAGGAIALDRPSGRRALAVTIDPLPGGGGLAGWARGAVIRVVDPEESASRQAANRWRALWRLTAAEARLAHVLFDCDCDLRIAADMLGITYATVRTQLAAIFVKTGVRSQPGLMRLLARIPG